MTTFVYQSDSRHMTEIPDNSVHCVVTSPPYFGLRLHRGLPDLVWGGNPECKHEWGSEIKVKILRGTLTNSQDAKEVFYNNIEDIHLKSGNFCQLCGAWRGQLGSEPTIELYIQHLVEVCREVKRVLRPDGVFWLNIGDSMAQSGNGAANYPESSTEKQNSNTGTLDTKWVRMPTDNLKPLDCCLVPFRVALALQSDGWYVRQDVVWNKKNPMPESVNGWRWGRHKVKVGNNGREQARQEGHFQNHSGDNIESDAIWQDCPGCPKCLPNDGYVLRTGSWRPTNAHEYIFMLTKTDNYYCDKESVREPLLSREPGMYDPGNNIEKRKEQIEFDKSKGSGGNFDGHLWNMSSSGRNLRSVWTFPTTGYSGSHFAVFPEELPLRCIKASISQVGVCSKCGKQWARVVDANWQHKIQGKKEAAQDYEGSPMYRYGHHNDGLPFNGDSQTLGFRPTCNCNVSAGPATILDPFAGTGTTLAVAKSLGHIGIGYELNPEYIPLIEKRLNDTVAGELSSQLQLLEV